MAGGWEVKVTGDEELRRFLQQSAPQLGDELAYIGARKAAGRLRTLLRRAAPEKTGTLRGSIRRKNNDAAKTVTVGLMTRFYYKVLEYGRKPYIQRNQGRRPAAGSPEMSRFAFFWKTVSSNEQEVLRVANEYAREVLPREAPKYIGDAPVRVE